MTTILTFGLLVLLLLLIALPGVAAIARPKTAVFAAPFYLILLTGLLVYHVGFSFGGRMPPSRAGEGPSNICEQALDQAQRGGLIVDRSNPVRVSVRRELWAQLPEQAQGGLMICLQAARPPAQAETPVAIVEVGPG